MHKRTHTHIDIYIYTYMYVCTYNAYIYIYVQIHYMYTYMRSYGPYSDDFVSTSEEPEAEMRPRLRDTMAW